MLPSSARSIGEQSVTTLPANRSIIIADSSARKNNELENAYDFNCDLSGTAIYAKEIYYQKLFWNQPIFSHYNGSSELLFQLNNDESVTYVVYATPYVMFTQYDGNDPGTSLLTPQPFSYAAMMEYKLNNDVRVMPLNTTLANGGLGYITDPTSPGHQITIRFRYSATKGFCIYPVQDSPTSGYYYSIRLVSCDYIAKGHYVHGFGFYNPNTPLIEYQAHDFFCTAIWSDCTPNLLPFRYIVIQSPELNKDRRLISFHNGNFANFVNELGIFSINPARNGVFHEVGVGDDATVISLRDDYTPQSFRIQILDEYGNVLHPGDPLSSVLQSNGIEPSVASSYLDGPSQGIGNSIFNDYLIFGYRVFRDSTFPLISTGVLEYLTATPGGMQNSICTFQSIDYNLVNVAEFIDLTYCTPLVLSPFTLTPSTSSQGLGFNSSTVVSIPFGPTGGANNFTVLTWYPYLNPFPTIQWDVEFETSNTITPGPGQGFLYLVMFDTRIYEIIMVTVMTSANTNPSAGVFLFQGFGVGNWVRNSRYVLPPSPATVTVGFCLAWVGLSTVYEGSLTQMYGASTPPTVTFVIQNPNNTGNYQGEYLPPDTTTAYSFGDPLAIALPEEVIHEIASILEYN